MVMNAMNQPLVLSFAAAVAVDEGDDAVLLDDGVLVVAAAALVHRPMLAIEHCVRVWSAIMAFAVIRHAPIRHPCHRYAVTYCQCLRISCCADFSHKWHDARPYGLFIFEIQKKKNEKLLHETNKKKQML